MTGTSVEPLRIMIGGKYPPVDDAFDALTVQTGPLIASIASERVHVTKTISKNAHPADVHDRWLLTDDTTGMSTGHCSPRDAFLKMLHEAGDIDASHADADALCVVGVHRHVITDVGVSRRDGAIATEAAEAPTPITYTPRWTTQSIAAACSLLDEWLTGTGQYDALTALLDIEVYSPALVRYHMRRYGAAPSSDTVSIGETIEAYRAAERWGFVATVPPIVDGSEDVPGWTPQRVAAACALLVDWLADTLQVEQREALCDLGVLSPATTQTVSIGGIANAYRAAERWGLVGL